MKVIIIKGAGRAFSAGFDLGARPRYTEGITPLMAKEDHIRHYHQNVWFTIWNLHKPVVASVHGYALAGASELGELPADLKPLSSNAALVIARDLEAREL